MNEETGGQSSRYKWLAFQKMRSVEELETLPAGTVKTPMDNAINVYVTRPAAERREEQKKRQRGLLSLPPKKTKGAIVVNQFNINPFTARMPLENDPAIKV